MKTLIVGDVHGRVEVVERALAQAAPVIFVGDFLDSFNRTVADQIKCLDLVLEAIATDKAQAILGNHELSYLTQWHRCSGWNHATQAHIDGGYRKKIYDNFVDFVFNEPNILITHAGLTKQLWDKELLTLELLPQILAEWCADIDSPAHLIGQARGGWTSYGGIFWCDFKHEFQEIPELVQVFGHSQDKTIRNQGNSYCIDCNEYNDELFYYDLPE